MAESSMSATPAMMGRDSRYCCDLKSIIVLRECLLKRWLTAAMALLAKPSICKDDYRDLMRYPA